MSYLELEGISKRYPVNGGEIVALESLDFVVAQGEFVVLLGPSGCGKSTLLQLVAGLEPPSSGELRLGGQPITHWDAERSLIFQQPTLFPWLTANQNVAFGLRFAGIAPAVRQSIAEQALANLGLTGAGGLYPHELSGGMQQRVALARALVLDPAVLLMDEPLASVDALLRSRLQHEIRTACANKTTLFVTHSIREALVLADRLIILSPRPGRVRREMVVEGVPPRESSPVMLELEREIEAELLH